MKRYLLLMVVFMATISIFAQEQQQQDSVTTMAEETPVPVPVNAQQYGIVAYDKAMQAMAEYKLMEEQIATQKAQYETELQKAADEFNAKYETFLSEQKSYAPSILRKRQSELEDLIKRNEQFKQESLKNIDYARQSLLKPIKEKLNTAISNVAQKEGLQFVLNSDNDGVPYFNQTTAVDITTLIISELTNSQTK